MNQSAVAYLRVSTTAQGKSGLGVAAQRDAISRFAETHGFTIVHTFEEVETGKGADALGSVGIQDSHGGLVVIQALDGPIRFDRRPVGEDGAALSGKAWRSGAQG